MHLKYACIYVVDFESISFSSSSHEIANVSRIFRQQNDLVYLTRYNMYNPCTNHIYIFTCRGRWMNCDLRIISNTHLPVKANDISAHTGIIEQHLSNSKYLNELLIAFYQCTDSTLRVLIPTKVQRKVTKSLHGSLFCTMFLLYKVSLCTITITNNR